MKNRACAMMGMVAALGWAALPAAQAAGVASEALAVAPVESAAGAGLVGFDGVVEAVRQTTVAAQVSGAVVEIRVKAGDTVKAGQVLLRIDARAAEQSAAAGDAQVQAARASLGVAAQEYERQKQLFQKSYISQAAFERAEAQFQATQAQVNAQLAQAGAARTQSGFYVVSAPYAGVVAQIPVTVGDMAMPGRTLLSLYDPSALRVSVMVPQSAALAATKVAAKGVTVEIPGLLAGDSRLSPSRVQVLPTVDPGTHTVEVRLDLARGVQQLAPGMFARAWLPVSGSASGSVPSIPRLFVPARAVVRRAEMTGLYVVDAQGHPQLRQVRLGPAAGQKIEILSGVGADEKVALDPQVAARAH